MIGRDAASCALARARGHARAGQDPAAKRAYVDVLRLDPTNFAALTELGAIASASGHRSAARTAYAQAARHHPRQPTARVGLANLLVEEDDLDSARLHYQAALDADPDFPPAHQGLARLLASLGDPAADAHWRKGFVGHAIVTQRYRGTGSGVPLLLLVSAFGGNVPTRAWIDDTIFAVTVIYVDFHDLAQPVPPHALVVNAVGDADLCGSALRRAAALAKRTDMPVINAPARVQATGRAANAKRMGDLQGVVAPVTRTVTRGQPSSVDTMDFPLLLRAPGFHTGQHFRYVETAAALASAMDAMPGETLLAIQYLDARGPDQLARKYRVMFVDGVCYPMHLAISTDWKVHYFTAAMADDAAHRQEEKAFLQDMPAVLGDRAMTALAGVEAALGLQYAGVDFAVAADGSLLLFEANATMAIVPPDPAPVWDYRRPAVTAVQHAARQMLLRHARPGTA